MVARKIARSAGNAATLLGYDASFAHIRMPSQEVRKVPVSCFASIGSVGNKEHIAGCWESRAEPLVGKTTHCSWECHECR